MFASILKAAWSQGSRGSRYHGNPYRDILGRFATKEKGVSSGGKKSILGRYNDLRAVTAAYLHKKTPTKIDMLRYALGLAHKEDGGFASVLKANPYHDEKGRFSTKDKAAFVSSGGKTMFHGTSVAELIEREGFKLAPTKNGKAFGEGVYLADSAAFAGAHGGTVLKVATKGMKIRRMSFGEYYGQIESEDFRTFRRNLRKSLTEKNGVDPMDSMSNWSGFAESKWFSRKGEDGIHLFENSKNDQMVIYSPSKLKVVGRLDPVVKKSDNSDVWFLGVIPPASKPSITKLDGHD